MKQLELINKRAKPKFCNWVMIVAWGGKGAVLCNKPAVVEIHKGNYCADHAEAAQKMFGQGKPIYALDSTGMKPTSPAVLRLEPKRNKK